MVSKAFSLTSATSPLRHLPETWSFDISVVEPLDVFIHLRFGGA